MYISWDLVSPLEYSAGSELDFTLSLKAPSNTAEKRYYVLGGLYTTDGVYIHGSLFGVFKAAGVDYGVVSTAYMSVWEIDPEEEIELPCKFIINRSGCLLSLFLMEMVSDEADLGNDVEIAQVVAQLVVPVPFEEGLMQSGVALISGVVLIGMASMMVRETRKEVVVK